MIESMFLTPEKSQKLAVILAMVSGVTPLSGLHKFYLGQPWWGLVYLFLSLTLTPLESEVWFLPYFGIAQTASLLEAVWYFIQSEDNFQTRFNQNSMSSFGDRETQKVRLVGETVAAIRQLDQLREEGLLSEYEFEQQRRQLMERIRN